MSSHIKNRYKKRTNLLVPEEYGDNIVNK